MNLDRNSNDDDDDDDDAADREEIFYAVDEQTRSLIEVVCNCLVSLADAQVNEDAADGIIAIADTLADRFGVDRLDSETYTRDDGEEEIIFKPARGLFSTNSDPDDSTRDPNEDNS